MLGASTSTIDAPTQFVDVGGETYAYRRFGSGDHFPLLCLQHFTGTLDNWDPAVTDPLAADREVILFENAGVGRSSGAVPDTVSGMAQHALAFLDGLGVRQVDILGFSLGGMIAQQMALDRPSIVRRMILVGTAPRGGEDIMQLEKPSLATYFGTLDLQGYEILQKVFFTPSEASQAAGAAFIDRLRQRQGDREPRSGLSVVQPQRAAFREWEQPHGERFADLKTVTQPTLVVNGVADEMIAVRNSYWLVENLPNAALVVLPDAGHGSFVQYHATFVRLVTAFLSSERATAPF